MLTGTKVVMTMAPLECLRTLMTTNPAFSLITAAVAHGFGSTIEMYLEFQESEYRIPAYAEESRISYGDSTVGRLVTLRQLTKCTDAHTSSCGSCGIGVPTEILLTLHRLCHGTSACTNRHGAKYGYNTIVMLIKFGCLRQ